MNNSGYKKWIERYLQECPGEIKDDNHTKRLNKVMLNVKSAVAELNEKQDNWLHLKTENSRQSHKL